MVSLLHRSATKVICTVAFLAVSWESGFGQRSFGQNTAMPRLSLDVHATNLVWECYAPCFLDYTLKNEGSDPVSVNVNMAGVPQDLYLLLTDSSGHELRHQLSLGTPSEVVDSVDVGSGTSLSGRALVSLSDDGFIFDKPGEHRIRLVWRDRSTEIGIESTELIVRVAASSPVNKEALDAFARIALERQGVDPMTIDFSDQEVIADVYHQAGKLLSRLAGRDRPHLIRSEGGEEDRREAEMVSNLRGYITANSNAPYLGYVARFLGLVDIKSFENKVSLLQHERIKAKEEPLRAEFLRQLREYKSTVELLQMAEDCLEGTDQIATYFLGEAYVLGEEWAQAEACVQVLANERVNAPALRLSAMLENARSRTQ